MRRTSLVISLLALFVALGGSAFAAASYINGSQIKPHSIPKDRLTGSAIAGLKGGKGARGYPGPQGAQGPQGVQGPPGLVSTTHTYYADFVVPAGDTSIHAIACPSGTGILSGGVSSISYGDTWYDAPSGNGWAGAADNYFGSIAGSVRIFEVCGVGVPGPSGSPGSTEKLEAAYRAKLGKLEAR